jgi:hypothetical protein
MQYSPIRLTVVNQRKSHKQKYKTTSMAFSPQADYTDRAATAYQQS